jgi:hypothetical protein
MKIAVCGDSYCAAPVIPILAVGERAHFSQMLEDQHGHKIINLAHGAMSNVGIWFQIREAIKLQPQFIVYNQTWSARIELMINKQEFDLANGLKNFIYSNPCYSSTGTKYVGNVKTGNVLSTVWQGLKDHTFVSVSDEQALAVDLYLKHLYNDALATEVDTWMFEYWHDQIIKNNIVPLKFNDAHVGKPAYDFYEINNRMIIDCPFHTDRATQQIIADNIQKIIEQHVDKSTQIM